jgi:hypothetical protein
MLEKRRRDTNPREGRLHRSSQAFSGKLECSGDKFISIWGLGNKGSNEQKLQSFSKAEKQLPSGKSRSELEKVP